MHESYRKVAKLWKGHRVDLELKDEWLEALNSIDGLNVCSVCAGHGDRAAELRSDPFPHVYFKLTPAYRESLFKHREIWMPYLAELFRHVYSYDIDMELEASSEGKLREKDPSESYMHESWTPVRARRTTIVCNNETDGAILFEDSYRDYFISYPVEDIDDVSLMLRAPAAVNIEDWFYAVCYKANLISKELGKQKSVLDAVPALSC